MEEKKRSIKEQQDAKVRCANYLLQMIEKYGAKIIAEAKQEETMNSTQISKDKRA